MANLSNDYPARILGTHEAPCLSLYQPTHRQFPDRQQDPIRFRNLVKQLETSLQQKYADRDIAPLLAPFNALADDSEFWNHGAEGLAVLVPRTCSASIGCSARWKNWPSSPTAFTPSP